MKRFAIGCWVLLATATPAAAQELDQRRSVVRPKPTLIDDVDEAAAAMHDLSPFLESSTMAVVDLDLTTINVSEAVNHTLPALGYDSQGDRAKQIAAMIGGPLGKLREAGVRHVYLTVSTRSIVDRGPLMVIPADDPQTVRQLASQWTQQLPPRPEIEVAVESGAVLIGPKVVVDRVRGDQVSQRPDLVLPLKSDQRRDHVLIVSLPGEAREELAAMWPDELENGLPVKVSPAGLVRDVERLRVDWNLPPDGKIRAKVTTPDAKGATRVAEAIGKVMSLTAGLDEAVDVEVGQASVEARTEWDTLLARLKSALAPARQRSRYLRVSNSMKQLGLAMHNYHDTYVHLPPLYYVDSEGEPLLSWRVAILPFIEQNALYQVMQLDEPWDSERNLRAGRTVIPTYQAGDSLPEMPHQTRIRIPVFPGSAWQRDGQPKSFRDITDGLSNTIAAIHAPEDAAVPWAAPEPWVISEDDPQADIFGDRDQVVVLMLDASVRGFTRDELTNERLKKLLTAAGGERID